VKHLPYKMGIFSFLKKIFEEPEEPVIKEEKKIVFSNIEEFLKEKIAETKTKENQAISLINEKINTFVNELKEKIKLVNQVDIESKEKNEKVKSVVYEGRKKYTEFLERFIEKLKDSQKINELKKFTESINSAFLRFDENSKKSYERATILIGKEMGNLRETMKTFSRELINIFNENKDIVSTLEKLSNIQSKINENKEINNKLKKIDESVPDTNNKILDKEKEIKEISEKIDTIENSQEYRENLEKISFIDIKEKEIQTNISELRQLIDFKALSNFFHIFEDKMAIVKLYRDNFTEEFKNDKGNRLLSLLNESKLNKEDIETKFKQINDKEQEIQTLKSEIKSDETKSLSSEIEKTKIDINELKNEINWLEKNKEKLKTQEQENINQIKEKLESMNIKIEEENEKRQA
jgi:DNA repair exonuclease SbcCD ATPase subunit